MSVLNHGQFLTETIGQQDKRYGILNLRKEVKYELD